VTLVPLAELLVKYGISRKTYHNYLNKGILPHWSKRHGEPGKRGARYLYDAEAFEAAWKAHVEKTEKGLGIDVEKRDERLTRFEKMPKFEWVTFILEEFPVVDGESLTDYEGRIAARRGELNAMTDDAVKALALDALRKGSTPRSWL